MDTDISIGEFRPTIMPLGDMGLLVRFSESLDDRANAAAAQFARVAEMAGLPGVTEIVPNLVSVLLRYDPGLIRFASLAGEVRLLAGQSAPGTIAVAEHTVQVRFGGEGGPDLDSVASGLGLSASAFVSRHCARPLRILATGFAPGFIYCGFHDAGLHIPRRSSIRDRVPPGSVLFAAGQTAIASTPIPTGWHVIGSTAFSNFDPQGDPPTRLRAGDTVRFEAL